jgi:ribosomal protein S18 acetylase RimI-like enzyme
VTDFGIRPFRTSDQDAVKALVLAGLADHWGELDPTLNPDLNDIAGWYGPMRGHTVVLDIDGEIAGTGTMFEKRPDVGELVRMSVSGDFRGQGIGKRLVRALADEAIKRGYVALECETTDTWQDAIGLYTALGFREVDRHSGDVFFRLDL